jgi:5-methylcytosine-specific restriction endonuclease McrA
LIPMGWAQPYTKQQQLYNKRQKPTQRQMGEISQTVRDAVKRRSRGVCEVCRRCNGAEALQMAHITSRKHLTHRTGPEDLLHSCVECHIWLDQHPDGIRFKRELRGA